MLFECRCRHPRCVIIWRRDNILFVCLCVYVRAWLKSNAFWNGKGFSSSTLSYFLQIVAKVQDADDVTVIFRYKTWKSDARCLIKRILIHLFFFIIIHCVMVLIINNPVKLIFRCRSCIVELKFFSFSFFLQGKIWLPLPFLGLVPCHLFRHIFPWLHVSWLTDFLLHYILWSIMFSCSCFSFLFVNFIFY